MPQGKLLIGHEKADYTDSQQHISLLLKLIVGSPEIPPYPSPSIIRASSTFEYIAIFRSYSSNSSGGGL